jgi:diguanylate cyclase (GGDEF)-like protein
VGWFWGWTFLSATLALLAGAEAAPRLESWLSALATCTAIASCAAGVAGAFLFRDRARMPRRVLALVALAGLTALLLQWRVDALDDILPVEIPLAVSALLQALVMFPMARSRRMAGLQTACAIEIVLTLMMGRSVFAGALLFTQGKELTELYWSFEVLGGIILCFVLAMGELIALLDEIRVELQQANDSLNEALEGLEAAAKLDPLTGLYNRYAFYTLMSDYTQKRKSGSIAIVDLNDLKRINDTYGHHAGDRALLNVAARLQEVVRQADYVFRWGGDEFVLLLFGMPPEAARERMAHCPPPAPLEVPRTQPVALTVSWGVARLQPDVDAALREADAQLYMQKRLLSSAAGRVSSP